MSLRFLNDLILKYEVILLNCLLFFMKCKLIQKSFHQKTSFFLNNCSCIIYQILKNFFSFIIYLNIFFVFCFLYS